MEFEILIQLGFGYGIVLSILLSVILIFSLWYNAEIWLSDYPQDIQEQYGPISEEAKQHRVLVAFPFFGVIILLPAIAAFHLNALSLEIPSFIDLFIMLFVIFLTFNVVDLLILDWLFFVYLTPDFIVLPGTEGVEGYDNYYFHFRGFLIGLVIVSIASVVFSFLFTILFNSLVV